MIDLATEKAFNDIRSTLIRRGVSRCEWRLAYFENRHDFEILWLIHYKRLYRYSIFNCPLNSVDMIKLWIEIEVGISLETESEKVSRIMDAYDI